MLATLSASILVAEKASANNSAKNTNKSGGQSKGLSRQVCYFVACDIVARARVDGP